MSKEKIKRLLAAFVACLGIGVFAFAGCATSNDNDGEPDNSTDIGGDDKDDAQDEDKKDDNKDDGTGSEGDDKDDGKDDDTDNTARPETQGDYVKRYISQEYIKNEKFYNYISAMADYDSGASVAVDAGDNEYVKVSYDYNFNKRITGDAVDIGATEKS